MPDVATAPTCQRCGDKMRTRENRKGGMSHYCKRCLARSVAEGRMAAGFDICGTCGSKRIVRLRQGKPYYHCVPCAGDRVAKYTVQRRAVTDCSIDWTGPAVTSAMREAVELAERRQRQAVYVYRDSVARRYPVALAVLADPGDWVPFATILRDGDGWVAVTASGERREARRALGAAYLRSVGADAGGRNVPRVRRGAGEDDDDD